MPETPGHSQSQVSRRAFLLGGATFATLALSSCKALQAPSRSGRFPAYPFTLGVASGEPTADGVVLWTRLAPRPLEPGGGMPQQPVEVRWRVASDETMTRIVRQGLEVADPAWAHSVHAVVDGLQPDRWYWYQFTSGGEASSIGRTRTLPPATSMPGNVRIAIANCQKYEVGFYTAYEHLVRENPDFVLHLGDYIYEKGDDSNAIRPHGQKEVFTLDDYRIRYALYKTDRALQAAHSIAPWFVTWDDHEVSNDYAGEFPERSDVSPADFLVRRSAAYQAYYENMPLRRSAKPIGSDLRLYRSFDFGALARFCILDTRQYRTDQPAGPRLQSPGPAQLGPDATILGTAQRTWLFDQLARSPAVWNVIAQQVLMAHVDLSPGGEALVDVDKWAGYEHERREVLRFLKSAAIRNPIVLTGDKHSNWANDLINDFDAPEPVAVAVEFLGTSISSAGDGVANPDYLEALLAKNPFVRFHNRERGYLVCDVTPERWRTDFKTVEYVSRRGASLNVRASFVVDSDVPKLRRI